MYVIFKRMVFYVREKIVSATVFEIAIGASLMLSLGLVVYIFCSSVRRQIEYRDNDDAAADNDDDDDDDNSTSCKED